MQLAGAEEGGDTGKTRKGKGKGKKGKGKGKGSGKEAAEPEVQEVPELEVKVHKEKKRAAPKSSAESKTKKSKGNQKGNQIQDSEKNAEEDPALHPKPKTKRARKTPPPPAEEPEEPQQQVVPPPQVPEVPEVPEAPAELPGDQVVNDLRAQIQQWAADPKHWTSLCDLFSGMYGDFTPSNAPKLTHYTLSMYWKKARVGLVHKPTKKHVLSYSGAGTGKIGLPLQACLQYALSSDPTCFLICVYQIYKNNTHTKYLFYQGYALI